MKKFLTLFLITIIIASVLLVCIACDNENNDSETPDSKPSENPSGEVSSGEESEPMFITDGQGTITGLTSCGERQTELTIPSKIGEEIITAVGGNILEDNVSVKKVVVSEGITTLQNQAFYSSGIKELSLPSTLKSIGVKAIASCDIEKIDLPSSLEKIEDEAFIFNRYLASLTIPKSTTRVGSYICGEYVLIKCEAKTKPNGWVDDFAHDNTPVVWDCDNNDVAEDGYIYYKSNDNVYYALKDIFAEVSNQSQFGATGDIKIAEQIQYNDKTYTTKSIRAFAFRSGYVKESPTSIEVAHTITDIGAYAFAGCNDLTRLTIPISVTQLGDSAAILTSCPKLTIYCEAKEQPSYWSSYWNSQGNVPVQWGLNYVTSNSEYDYVLYNDKVYLDNYKGSATQVTIPRTLDGKEVVDFGTAYMGKNITDVIIPQGFTKVSGMAFRDCELLQNIELSDTLCFIDNRAFEECVLLNNVDVAESITYIGYNAFDNCHGLTNINLSDNITYIGQSAFARCRELQEINIPEGVTQILANTFNGCNKLAVVKFSSNLKSIGRQAFINCNYLENLIFNDNLQNIEASAFYNCTGLQTVLIPSSVVTIGNFAFKNGTEAIFNCKADIKPDGWSQNWCEDSCTIVWGYVEEEQEEPQE